MAVDYAGVVSEALTREDLLQLLAQQAAQTTRLVEQNSEQAKQIKVLIEEDDRLNKRIEQLERQVKRYVAPHSREAPIVDPKPPGHAGIDLQRDADELRDP